MSSFHKNLSKDLLNGAKMDIFKKYTSYDINGTIPLIEWKHYNRIIYFSIKNIDISLE